MENHAYENHHTQTYEAKLIQKLRKQNFWFWYLADLDCANHGIICGKWHQRHP